MSNPAKRRLPGKAVRVGAQVVAAVLLVVGVLLAYNGMAGRSPLFAIGGFIVMGLSVGLLVTPLTAKIRASRSSYRS